MVKYGVRKKEHVLVDNKTNNESNRALAMNKGNYDAIMALNEEAIDDIMWWLHNIENQYALLNHAKPSISLFTDSSKDMWGGAHR